VHSTSISQNSGSKTLNFETGIKVVDLLAPYRRGGKSVYSVEQV
jgi:F0F1-type ATP synthase beta subunit